MVPRRSDRSDGRPTIGLAIHSVADSLGMPFWAGVADVAREKDANLICSAGGMLRSPHGFDAQRNVLYNLLNEESMDGLVIWTGILGHYITLEELQDFCGRYHNLPMVSVEVALPGIPTVVADFYQGMCDVVAHLIEVHSLSRIAFIRGPEGSETGNERYRAYVDTLAKYEIESDSNLVVPGTFFAPSGAQAIRLLLDERKADFEAVVAANDNMAIDAARELEARGIRLPDQVAVAGLDDLKEARAVYPPLTTARLPLYELGRRGAEMLLAGLRGEQMPEREILPVELVVRQSCGCESRAVTRAREVPAEKVKKELGTMLKKKADRRAIVAAIAEEAGIREDAVAWVEQLLEAFAAEMGDERKDGALLSALREALRQAASGIDVAVWQNAVCALRCWALSFVDRKALSRAEAIWHQALVMLAEEARRTWVYQALQVEQQVEMLDEISVSLLTTKDVGQLMDVLAEGLPRLGIPGSYLSLWEAPEPYAYPASAPAHSRLVLACSEKGRVGLEDEGQRFPSTELVPAGMLPGDRRFDYVCESLCFRESQIGFALFEAGPREGKVYDALRRGVSTALYGALLLQARKEAEAALELAYAKVEKQVQERTAELEQEVAKREAAQKKSIELQQEVIEAQQRAIQELSTPIIPVMEQVVVMPLIGSIDTLRARDIMRRLLAGIREHQARVVILDITGVPLVDSGVAAHLSKSVQAARLKGARVIITGMNDSVAETVVDLGLDWTGIETMGDLRTGLRAALAGMGMHVQRR